MQKKWLCDLGKPAAPERLDFGIGRLFCRGNQTKINSQLQYIINVTRLSLRMTADAIALASGAVFLVGIVAIAICVLRR